MNISGLVASDRNVDGVVDMMLDATLHYQQSLSEDRLFGWQSALFPTGRSGMSKIIVGSFRDDTNGTMLVVSGTIGRERVHFEAPAAIQLKKEIAAFIRWFNNENDLDSVLKAGLAHFWFVTIHPFDDGNGRIARTITDMLLARSDGVSQRFYSMSAQIRKERKQYYDVLEKSQKGSLNITDWLEWFLNCLYNTLNASEKIFKRVLIKHQFWNKNATAVLNSRQVLMLNKLLDGFTGKMTSSKWAKITKCSADTALRDIQDLIKKQVLKKDLAGGRSTNYELK
jgi:Fic family protein